MVEETDYGGCWHKVSFSYGQHLHKHENKIFNHYNITRKQDFWLYKANQQTLHKSHTDKSHPKSAAKVLVKEIPAPYNED